MLYNIIINQKSIIDNNWNDLKANHLAVLTVIKEFILSASSHSLKDDLGTWYWVNNKLIVNQLPMFDIKERRCADLIKVLCQYELIELNPNNRKLNRTYLRMGKKINLYTMNNRALQNIAEGTQNIAEGYAENCVTDMQKIADDNNTNNNNTKDNYKKAETKVSAPSLFKSESKSKNKTKSKNDYSEDVLNLTRNLYRQFPEHIKNRIEKDSKMILPWLETVEKLKRIDKYTDEEIFDSVKSGLSDSFQSKNFQSLSRLRKPNKDGVKYIDVFLSIDSPYNKTKNTGGANYESHIPTESDLI